MYEVFNTQTGETLGYVETEWEACWESRTRVGSFDYWEDTEPTNSCSHNWLGACVDCVRALRKKGLIDVSA